MGIGRTAAADEAGLMGDEAQMVAIALARRLANDGDFRGGWLGALSLGFLRVRFLGLISVRRGVVAKLAEPRQRGRRAAAPPLKELGDDPVSKKPIVLKEGRFGPYVTDGETNASLKAADSVESITPERAAELLQARREAGPAKKRRAAKKRS